MLTALATFIPIALILKGGAPESLPMQIVCDFCFPLACAGTCMFALAAVLQFATRYVWVLHSLSQNAYRMYLIHYPFPFWLQYALLGHSLPAYVKGMLAFGGTLLLSWKASGAIGFIPVRLYRGAAAQKALARAP